MAGINFGLYNAAADGQRAGTQDYLNFLRSADAINTRRRDIATTRGMQGLDPNRNAGVSASLGDMAMPPSPGDFAVQPPATSATPVPPVPSSAPYAATPPSAGLAPRPAQGGAIPPQQVRAGMAGAPGINQIDPNASQFSQDYTSWRAGGQVSAKVNQIADRIATGQYGADGSGKAGNMLGQAWGYFADSPAEAGQRGSAQEALAWYKSEEGKMFFQANPEALAQAEADPVGTYNRVMGASKSTAGLKGGKQAQPKAPGAPAVTPQSAIRTAAQTLQLDPTELAAAVSYETAGTFDPWKKGPTTKWGEHRGLIQWGETQRNEYGVTEDMTFDQQMEKVVEYALDRGFKPGEMGIAEFYSTVNAGSPGRMGASDVAAGGDKSAPTVGDKVSKKILGEHLKRAQRWMGVEDSEEQMQEAQIRQANGGAVPDWVKGKLNATPMGLSQDYQRLDQVRQARRQAMQTKLNTLARQRADTQDKLQVAQRSGDVNLMAKYRSELDSATVEIDGLRADFQEADITDIQRMEKLQTDDALLRLSLGDPRMAAEVYSRQTGLPIAFERRADGKLNIYMRGPDGAQRTGVADVNEVGRMLRNHGDERYRDMDAAASSERSGKMLESQLKIQEKVAGELAQMRREEAIETIKGNNKLRGYKSPGLGPDGRSVIMMSEDGSHALRYIPDEVVEGPDGEEFNVNAIKVVRGPEMAAIKGAGLTPR